MRDLCALLLGIVSCVRDLCALLVGIMSCVRDLCAILQDAAVSRVKNVERDCRDLRDKVSTLLTKTDNDDGLIAALQVCSGLIYSSAHSLTVCTA